MGTIKPLSESIRSSVRSGFIVSDLTRIVEELLYNSLDADAHKVSVSVDISAGYVKVEDDGSGINRDGLALLGERYVTSKQLHLAGSDTIARSFGSRGESLCSISDVSLLELRTKVHGRPNGYRKIMKSRKCLYLGIDDERRDVGTTVMVRDTFYNQPVRRRQMQTSLRKVLDAVKKCILQIALVRPKVSFCLFDIDSEVELLRIHTSSSSLSILSSHLGVEVSSLQEFSVSEGTFQLVGYLCGPCDLLSSKGVQYVYINSKFIAKGPIHKLLNRLATTCLFQLNDNKVGKRNRSQAFPTYLLNLICPQSSYDLTFEESRTCAEFKDWIPVLTLIEKYVAPLWSIDASDDLLQECRSPQTRTKTYNDGFQEPLFSSPVFYMNMPTQKYSPLPSRSNIGKRADLTRGCEVSRKRCKVHSNGIQEASVIPSGLSTRDLCSSSIVLYNDRATVSPSLDIKRMNNLDTDEEFNHSMFVERAYNLSKSIKDESNYNIWGGGDYLTSLYDEDLSFIRREDKYEEDLFGSRWMDEPFRAVSPCSKVNKTEGSLYHFLPDQRGCNLEATVKDDRKPFLQHCSYIRKNEDKMFPANYFSPENTHKALPHDAKWPSCQSLHEPKRRHIVPGVKSEVNKICGVKQTSDIFQRSLWENEVGTSGFIPGCGAENDFCENLDNVVGNFHDSHFIDQECAATEHDIGLLSGEDEAFNVRLPLKLNCDISDSVLGKKSWDFVRLNHEIVSPMNQKNTLNSEDLDGRYGHENISSDYSELAFTNSSSSLKTDVYSPFACGELDNISSLSCYIAEERDIMYSKFPEDSIPSSVILRSQSAAAGRGPNINLQSCHRSSGRKCKINAKARSQSAPPTYRGRRKFLSVSSHLTCVVENLNGDTTEETNTVNDIDKADVENILPHFSRQLDHLPEASNIEEVPSCASSGAKLKEGLKNQLKGAHTLNDLKLEGPWCYHNMSSGQKMANDYPEAACNDHGVIKMVRVKRSSSEDKTAVLDIASGILHLSSDVLVPKSIHRNCLKNTKVLFQVDKKFIPVLAGSTLTVIDQHAADERIRLEELRQKVISGEMKTITYLKAEKELILPETAYQLLDNYAEQIRNWGWICNISPPSHSFTKSLNLLKKQPAKVTLIAVPCILGVNLSDADLLEFIDQLADTDGSSTMPPSVLRVLNYKSCRGAIMFGDKLLPSECALIVEELKQTSLCFQCAHGRPTMAPLVDMKVLHKQIEKLESLNATSSQSWHGLRRQCISLERAKKRVGNA